MRFGTIVRFIALGTGMVALTACPPSYDIWLLPGSTIDHLDFGMATKRNGTDLEPLMGLRLSACTLIQPDLRRTESRTLWLAREATPGVDTPLIARWRYGTPVPGLADSTPPPELTPGCYIADVYANPGFGRMIFLVQPDGQARALTKAEQDSMWTISDRWMAANLAADETATRECRARYGQARSSADSVVVDSLVPYDTLRFARLTCAVLRRVDPTRVGSTASQGEESRSQP
jgi:hypothetical protein